MNIARKSVSMCEVSPTDPTVEKIEISDQLAEFLRKDPVCGRSDYTDLNEPSSNHGSTWRSFAEYPRRSDSSSLSRATIRNSEEYKKKKEESRRRQKLKREKIIRRREEKRAIQRARLRERHRQQEIFDQLHQRCQSPKEGVVIAISPQKISPAKKKNKHDRDSYLYDRFKLKTLQHENGLSTLSQGDKNESKKSSSSITSNEKSTQYLETDDKVLSNIESIIDTVVSSSSPLSGLEDMLDSEASTNVEDSDDDTEVESFNEESSDSGDPASKPPLAKMSKEKGHYKTRGSWSAETSTSPEAADPDSPAPAVTRRSMRQGKRVNYTETYDDIEEVDESTDEGCTTSTQKGSNNKSSEKSTKKVSRKRKSIDSTTGNELNVSTPRADEAKKDKGDGNEDPQVMKSTSEYLGLSSFFSPSPLVMSTPLTNTFSMHSDVAQGQYPSFPSSQPRLPCNPLFSPGSSHRLSYESPPLFIPPPPHCVHPQLPPSHRPPYISQRGFDSPGGYFSPPPHLYPNLMPPPPMYLPTPLPHWSHNGPAKDSHVLGNVKQHPGPVNSNTQTQLKVSSPSTAPVVTDIPKSEILPPNFLMDLQQTSGCSKPDQRVNTVSKAPVKERSLDFPKHSYKNHNVDSLICEEQANDNSVRGLDTQKHGPNQFVVNLNDSCGVSASRHVKIDLNHVPVSKHQNFLLTPLPLERLDGRINAQHPLQTADDNKAVTKVSSKLDSLRAVEEMLQQTLLKEAGARSRLFDEREASKDRCPSEKGQQSVIGSRQHTISSSNLQSPGARQSDAHSTGMQPWGKNHASNKAFLLGEPEYNMVSSSKTLGAPPMLSSHYSMNSHLSPRRNHLSDSPTMYSQTFNQPNVSSYQHLMGSPLTLKEISVPPSPSTYQTNAGHLLPPGLQSQPLNGRGPGSFEMSRKSSNPHAIPSHPNYHQNAVSLNETMHFSSSVRTPPTPHYPSVQSRSNALYPASEFTLYSQTEQLSTASRQSSPQMHSYPTQQQLSLSDRLNPTGIVSNYSTVSSASVCTNPYSSNTLSYSMPNLTEARSKFTSEPRVSGMYSHLRDHAMLQPSHTNMHAASLRGPWPHKNFNLSSPSQTFGSLPPHSASTVKTHNQQEQRFPFGNQGQFSLELRNLSASHHQNISHNSSTDQFSMPEFYNQMVRGESHRSQPLRPGHPNSNNKASVPFNITYSEGPNSSLSSAYGHRPQHNLMNSDDHRANHQNSASNKQRDSIGQMQKPSNNQPPNRNPALSLPTTSSQVHQTTNAQVHHPTSSHMHNLQSCLDSPVAGNNARHPERHPNSQAQDVKPLVGSLHRALDLSHKEQSQAPTEDGVYSREPNYGPPNQSIFSPPTFRQSVCHLHTSSTSKQAQIAPPPQKAAQKPSLPTASCHREDSVSHSDRIQPPPSSYEGIYLSHSDHNTYRPMTTNTQVKPRDVKPILSSLVSALDLGSNAPQKGAAKELGTESPTVKESSNHGLNQPKSNPASSHQFYDHPLTAVQIKQEYYHAKDATHSQDLSTPLTQPANPKPATLNKENSGNTRLTRTLSADGEKQFDARMELKLNRGPVMSTTSTKTNYGNTPYLNSSSLDSEACAELVRIKAGVNSPCEEQQTGTASNLSETSVATDYALKTASNTNCTRTNHKALSTMTPHTSTNTPATLDTMTPHTSTNTPATLDTMTPHPSINTPTTLDTMTPHTSTNTPATLDTMTPHPSINTPATLDTMTPHTSTNTPATLDTISEKTNNLFSQHHTHAEIQASAGDNRIPETNDRFSTSASPGDVRSLHAQDSHESAVKYKIHNQEKDSEHVKEKQLGDTCVSGDDQISSQPVLSPVQLAPFDNHTALALPRDEFMHSNRCDEKKAAARIDAPLNSNPDPSANIQMSESGALPSKSNCNDQEKDSSSALLISNGNQTCLNVDSSLNVNTPTAKQVAVVLPPPRYTQLKSPEREEMLFVWHTSGPTPAEDIAADCDKTTKTGGEIGQECGGDLDLGLAVQNPYIVTIGAPALVSAGPHPEHSAPEPDLSLVKEECGGTLATLNLREVIDLSDDNDGCVVEMERHLPNAPDVPHSCVDSQNTPGGIVDRINTPQLGDSFKNKEVLPVVGVDADPCENPDPSSRPELPDRSPKSFTKNIITLKKTTASKALSVPVITSPLTGQTVVLNSQQIDYIKNLEAKMKEDISRIIAGPLKRPQSTDAPASDAGHTKEPVAPRVAASQQTVPQDISQPRLSTSQTSSNSYSISVAEGPPQNNGNQVKNMNRMHMKEEPDDSVEGDNDDAVSTCSSEVSHSSYVSGVSSSKTRRSSSSSFTQMKDHQAEPLSARAQQAISLISSWTKEEVSTWLKAHHFDKVCPNLSCLDSKGLQRMAFEYHHDPDLFYNRIKKSLGLKLFQTMVICNGMKELCKSSDKSD